MPSAPHPTPQPTWQPHAAVAAWLLPGLGHLLLGQHRRALVIALSVGGLWLAGLLIGGISVIDRRDAPEESRIQFSLWFIGQSLTAPSVAVDWLHQTLKNTSERRYDHLPQPGDRPQPVFTPSFGRVWEIGVLYTALAGMLNLLAIMDVAYGQRGGVPAAKAERPR